MMRFPSHVLIFAACSVLASGCGLYESRYIEDGPKKGWPKEIIIGLFGSDDANEVLERHEPIRKFLEQELEHPIRFFTGTSYTIVIEAMKAERADAMMVGAFSYSVASSQAGAEAIAVSVNSLEEKAVYDPEQKPFYYSFILTKKGNGIRTLDDLRGKDFLFVDPVSTSGHLFPRALLLRNGIDPEKDMNFAFSNSHPVSLLQVYNGRTPACASYEYELTKMHREGVIEYCGFPDGRTLVKRTQEELDEAYEACPEGYLVPLAQSDPIPRTPFAVKETLPESLKTAMRDALLEIKDHPEVVAEIRQWFADPTQELGLERLDQFYDPIREAAKLIDMDLSALNQ